MEQGRLTQCATECQDLQAGWDGFHHPSDPLGGEILMASGESLEGCVICPDKHATLASDAASSD